jgi:Mg-chelatase subunit ChlD
VVQHFNGANVVVRGGGKAQNAASMDWKQGARRTRAERLGGWCIGLLLFACSSAGTVGGGTGGNDQSGGVGSGGSAGSSGGSSGTSGTDDAGTFVNLDVQPAWWGTADAPQGPEAELTADANCGLITSQTTRKPVDVLLVLDRSGSMDYSIAEDCYCNAAAVKYGSLCADTTACTTRWDAVKPAVRTTLSGSSYVNWGLKFFPSAGAGQNCTLTPTMEVEVTANAATAVESAVDNAVFEYSTPTAAALTAATAYLKGLNDGNEKTILLATDGEPNCGGTRPSSSTDDLTGATTASAAAAAAGFPVYVVGIGPTPGNLTQLAQAGGTGDFYPVNSPQQLADALSSITKLVGSCSFKADQPPPDPNNVAVYVNKQKLAQDADNGWTFGANPQEIVLTGDNCTQMSSGNQVDVQILFGCPGQDFPPQIW